MKFLSGVLLFTILTAKYSSGQDSSAVEAYRTASFRLEPLLGYNFGNKGGWASLSPEIFLGCDTLLYADAGCRNRLRFRFGPTISANNDLIDSNNYFSSIMLPGPASLSMLLYNSRKIIGNKLRGIAILGTGLKVIGHSGKSGSMTQTNIKAGGGVEIARLFVVSMEYTWGWHSITTESELNFKKTFGTPDTRVRYLTLNLEGYSQPLDLFIFLSWRRFLNYCKFEEYYRSDRKIISVGVRKNIDLMGDTVYR